MLNFESVWKMKDKYTILPSLHISVFSLQKQNIDKHMLMIISFGNNMHKGWSKTMQYHPPNTKYLIIYCTFFYNL